MHLKTKHLSLPPTPPPYCKNSSFIVRLMLMLVSMGIVCTLCISIYIIYTMDSGLPAKTNMHEKT